MSHVFPRHTKATLPMAMDGDGCYLIDADGKRYLDCGDAAVSCLGHSDQAVIAAVENQVARCSSSGTSTWLTISLHAFPSRQICTFVTLYFLPSLPLTISFHAKRGIVRLNHP